MSAADLGALLTASRERIVATFVAEVERKDLPPRGLPRSLLVDHIPRFLDEIVVELRTVANVRTSQEALETSPTAEQHGEQRWTLGYDLEALIREYGVLRHCILRVAREAGLTLSVDEFDVLAKCLSVGVAAAATEYARHRDEQLRAQRADLEFLAEAGKLLTSSLDYRATLRRLTGLLVPKMADWCAVHVEGDGEAPIPIAHVDPAKAKVVDELYRRYRAATAAPVGYGEVRRTGRPVLVSEVAPGFLESIARDAEHLDLLRQINCSSWMIVPLKVQNTLIGAITLAYGDSGRRYDDRDLLLTTDVAQRAAVAIDNARLYELSQKERSRVEAATRAKDEFVAMVSHELRTPLTAIIGWLRLMRAGTIDTAKRAHAIDVIERNAEALNRLIADLLDISRVITGKIRINPSQIDLGNTIDLTVEGIRPAADAKRLALELDIDRANAVVRADGDRLQQVAWNLLANAVKYSPKGGVVRVRLRRVDSDVELTVEDNGEGIEPAFLPHVFESFRQSEGGTTRAHGGLGIGLSIAKHIVELHGGTIAATSAGRGQGSIFTVRIPVSPVVSSTLGIPRIPATHPPSPGPALPTGLTSIRILLVDDERDARELVALVLETCGMEVRVAGSSAEALDELSRYLPDVILSDIGMPGDDGYVLIRSIRTLPDEKRKNLPAIALTAFARNEDRTRALVEGFNLYLAKPVEPAALVQAVVELAGATVK